MPTIGEKIRELRMQRGLTQSELGGELVTASMISQIEADRAKPSYTLLNNIANRLGMTVEYFMNDMDEQFAVSAHLSIAAYFTLTEQPTKALEILEKIPEQQPYGLSYQDYLILQAKSYRLLGRYQDAISQLEYLREYAYRTQDKFLQFRVCKESGYIEYGLKNLDGAMHEWRKAIQLGESLATTETLSSVQMNGEMTEILIVMDEIVQKLDPVDGSSNYLSRGAELSRLTGNFRDIGEALIQDAHLTLESDAARAKSLADKAISLLESARLVEQYILINTKLHEADGTHCADPWTQAALATASVSPITFIEAECMRIERYLDVSDIASATRRLDRCFEILEDYRAETRFVHPRTSEMESKLAVYHATIRKLEGNILEAIGELESLADRLSLDTEQGILIKVWAQLVIWYGEINDEENVFRLSQKIEDTLGTQKRVQYV